MIQSFSFVARVIAFTRAHGRNGRIAGTVEIASRRERFQRSRLPDANVTLFRGSAVRRIDIAFSRYRNTSSIRSAFRVHSLSAAALCTSGTCPLSGGSRDRYAEYRSSKTFVFGDVRLVVHRYGGRTGETDRYARMIYVAFVDCR